MAGETVFLGIRHRSKLRPVRLPPWKGRSQARRVPFLALDPTAFVVAQLRHRVQATRRSKGPPPFRGRSAGRRVPYLALDPTSFVVVQPGRQRRLSHVASHRPPVPLLHSKHRRTPRPVPSQDQPFFVNRAHRQAHHVLPGVPAKGRKLRRRVPYLAFNPGAFVVGRHHVYLASHRPLPQRGKAKRRTLPPTGLSATIQLCLRKRHRTPRLVPFAGRRKRRTVPPSGLVALQVVQKHRRAVRGVAQAAPFFRGKRHRAPVPGQNLVPAAVVRMHRQYRPARFALPPARGRRLRRKLIGTGLTAAFRVGRHRVCRTHRQPPPLLLGHVVRRQAPTLGGVQAPIIVPIIDPNVVTTTAR